MTNSQLNDELELANLRIRDLENKLEVYALEHTDALDEITRLTSLCRDYQLSNIELVRLGTYQWGAIKDSFMDAVHYIKSLPTPHLVWK
jgi:hypothetical protein